MLALRQFFSKKNNVDDKDQYIKITSLIKEGSVLDRRKVFNNRRSGKRRIFLNEIFFGKEKRIDADRRAIFSRRERDLTEDKLENSIEKPIEKKTIDISQKIQSLSEVDRLILDQVEIINCMSDLSAHAKATEFEEIDEKIRSISFKLKSIKREEEKLLYLSFDSKAKIVCKNSEKSVTEVLDYIHGASDKAIEFLDRYYSGVTEASIGFFLLDMNIVQKELTQVLEKKKENLYPMYENS